MQPEAFHSHHEAAERLYRVKAPTLLVWGAQDRLVDPAYGDAFVAAIPDARLEVVDGAGHLPQLEQIERTTAVVTEFFG